MSMNPFDPYMMISASNGLYVLLIETKGYDRSFSKKLLLYTDSLEYYTVNGPWPKCLLFHVSKNFNMNIDKHLKSLWEKKFLDFTIIEIIPANSESKKLKSNYYGSLNIRIHYYNPFKKIYTNQTYSSAITLFPDKLDDLYGYPLRTVRETNNLLNIPEERVKGKNLKDWDFGYYGALNRIFKQTLNFTVIPVPNINVGTLLKEKKIDYYDCGILKNLQHTHYTTSAPIPAIGKTHLLIKQESQNKIKVRWEFLIYIVLIVVVIIVTILLKTVLRFDSEYWTADNILSLVIMGSSHFTLS